MRTRWLKALRGGKYKQAEGKLQDREGRNCCLGVLGRIIGYKKNDLLDIGMPYNMPKFPTCIIGNDNECTIFASKLSQMNDGYYGIPNSQKNFKEIANYIEKHTIGV